MINSLLTQVLKDKIDPHPSSVLQAEESQKRLRQILKQKLEVDDSLPVLLEGEDFLYGSAVRGTQITPFDDIDLMLVLDGSGLVSNEGSENTGAAYGSGRAANPVLSEEYLDETGHVSSQKILNKIRFILKDSYPRSEIKKDGEAVNVWMDSYGFGIDIVPAFIIDHTTHGVHYFIPVGTGSHMWRSTNPWKDLYAFNEEDQRLKGLLTSTARLLRKWNIVKNDNRLSGFHIDALVYHTLYGKNIYSLEDSIRLCFSSFSRLLSGFCPQFSGFSPHIDHKLTDDHRNNTIKNIQATHSLISTVKPDAFLSVKNKNLDTWDNLFGGTN